MLNFPAELLSIELRPNYTFTSMASHPCQQDTLSVFSSLPVWQVKYISSAFLIVSKVKNLFVSLRTILFLFCGLCFSHSLLIILLSVFALLKLICQCSLHFRKFTLWLRFQCARFFLVRIWLVFTLLMVFCLAENFFILKLNLSFFSF